jgi:O-acetyl-ADP-ribose deacetylase
MNKVLKERILPTSQNLQIVQGDITTEEVDVIVNAANERLQHGGGVAWAISKRGGPAIQTESDEWIQTKGRVSHAHPAWTSGGRLPARYVIHAVGPIWDERQGLGDEADAKLAEAVSGSLQVADELGLKSIAFPAISTGIYGFPKERAAKVILRAIETYFRENTSAGIKIIKLVLFDQQTAEAFLEV